LAALLVLAVAAVAWILCPAAAGYIGGFAWLLLLFVPAIGLRKMAQLAAQGNYQAAGRLGAGLQILHPSAELRGQVQLFRQVQSNPAFRTNFSSVPTNYAIPASARRNPFQNAPAVLILIAINVLAFLLEISAIGLIDLDVLHRIVELKPYCAVTGGYWRV